MSTVRLEKLLVVHLVENFSVFLWNRAIHYRVDKRPPVDPVQSQMIQVHNLTLILSLHVPVCLAGSLFLLGFAANTRRACLSDVFAFFMPAACHARLISICFIVTKGQTVCDETRSLTSLLSTPKWHMREYVVVIESYWWEDRRTRMETCPSATLCNMRAVPSTWSPHAVAWRAVPHFATFYNLLWHDDTVGEISGSHGGEYEV
jgi:hypothetical protein